MACASSTRTAQTTHAETESCFAVAEHLAGKGFNVRQLLQFYKHHLDNKVLDKNTSTENVVRNIVIPQTAAQVCCYMDSAFMRTLGGPKAANKLVSHSWGVPFLNTLLNVLYDVSGVHASFVRSRCLTEDGELDVEGAFQWFNAFMKEELDETYWLCIFAVNEHRAICGDCWTCNPGGCSGWTSADFANPYCNCGLKRNPCSCGSLKYGPGDPSYEIDKFPLVVQQMKGGLVASLDARLQTLRRVWVVSEVAEAFAGRPVRFRMVDPLHEDLQRRLMLGDPLVPLVRDCLASSKEDKDRILEDVRRAGGEDQFDEFLACLVDLHFGRCKRLQSLSSIVARRFEHLTELSMDFNWCRKQMSDSFLRFLGFQADVLAQLTGLRTLELNLSHCPQLTDLTPISDVLSVLSLTYLYLNLNHCPGLSSVMPLRVLGGFAQLQFLELRLESCTGLTTAAGLEPLGNLAQLEGLELYLNNCPALVDVAALSSLGGLVKLQRFSLSLSNCKTLADVAALESLGSLAHLRNLELHLSRCPALTSVAPLVGLSNIENLQTLVLGLHSCSRLADVVALESLGSGSLELRSVYISLAATAVSSQDRARLERVRARVCAREGGDFKIV